MRRGTFRAALLAAVALSSALAGCREDVTGLDSGDSALVYGTVSDAGGRPVDSAAVRTTAYSELCGSRVAVASETRTDARGRYADTLLFFRTRLRGCLAVEAVPLAGRGLGSHRVEVPTRTIRSAGIDSVHVNFTLDSASGRGVIRP